MHVDDLARTKQTMRVATASLPAFSVSQELPSPDDLEQGVGPRQADSTELPQLRRAVRRAPLSQAPCRSRS